MVNRSAGASPRATPRVAQSAVSSTAPLEARTEEASRWKFGCSKGSGRRLRLQPPAHAGHVLRELGAELREQGALLGLDLVPSHVGDVGGQEQGCADIRQITRPAREREEEAK